VNWIDTGLVASVLVVLGFAGAGFFTWRSHSRGPLDSGPFWWWAWASVLIAGLSTKLAQATQIAVYVPPLLSPVFSAFLVAGALRYRARDVPVWLLPGAIVLGAVRAVAEGWGFVHLSGMVSLAVEPTGALIAAFLVHRGAATQQASWLHRLMPIGFVAIAAVEMLGASRALFGLTRLVIWPLWLASGIPLVGLQVLIGMERILRAEGESERDRAGREQVNERLELLAENIREVISEITRDGIVSWVSGSCRAALGIEPESIVGKDYREATAILGLEEVDDADAAAVLGVRHRPASSAAKPRARIYKIRDGHGRTRYFETRMARESDSRILAFSRDVTDQMAAQHTVRTSEERFRTFSLLGSDYCFVSTGELGSNDTNVHWITGSLEQISGYSHAELQEIGFAGFIHPDELAAAHQRVMGLLRSGGQSSHEFRMLTKSGEVRWIAENLLVELEGTKFSVYGAARDVSDQRRLEQALASSQKLDSLGLLAGGIAHDFNNLLMVILGNTEMALDSAGTSPVARRDLEGIIDAVGQAQTLTQQLLAYAGRGAVEHVPVDLSERVRSVSELLASAGAADVELELDLKDGLPAVLADPGEIQQLAMNLVLNAIEACEGAGRVRVCARMMAPETRAGAWLVGEPRKDTRYVELEVSDDGVGIDREKLGRVFDPFFSTKTAGRGLGLAAVIGIVRAVGGAVRVESSAGEGTRFVVLLPASSREAVPEKVATTKSDGDARGRILVVDDDERVQQVAVRMLRGRGFEVSTACDGRSAVEAVRETDFDVILLDAVMPGMTAAETFDALRALRPGVKVLMVSGFDMEQAAGDLLDRGLAGFVGKPFRTQQLVARIQGLISGAS
jgi:two-component system cell cycle sensor histidine kinase/response regulator CckA